MGPAHLGGVPLQALNDAVRTALLDHRDTMKTEKAGNWRAAGVQSFRPVSRSYASRYFACVRATMTGGSDGAGGSLFHLSVSR